MHGENMKLTHPLCLFSYEKRLTEVLLPHKTEGKIIS